ncbi:hypothetical protein PLESTB_000951300 [Pleodorina starrii]|uniref:Phosphoglycerate mutase family protein n=1 Tax=Pleodorina starrii TaxID=330485 RepID=A0A9W6F462_9CHLO|nr:hypothetical protein PLESTB_000951300 [Pleodorina starrii]
MGKNLKRQNVVLGTPGGASRQSGQPPLSIGGKRQKQMSLFPFLRTPAHAEETPALQFKTGNAGISSTGLHKLGQLQLQTQQNAQKQPSNGLNVAPTQVRPAVPEPQCQDASPGSDDDFVISMSQTYERTQPEPCWDFGSAEHEEVELSLRRTQQYQAAASTQHYNYHHHHNHHHELLVAAVATTLDNTDSAAAAISTADAVEASVAHASAVGHGTAVASAATILLPPEVLLEGQGSNQPGNVAVFLAAASREQSRMGPRPAVNIDFHGHFQTSALPAVSSGPAQTPELQIGGICVGGIGGGGAAGNGGIGGSACTTVAEDMVDDGTTPPLQVGLPLFPIFAQGGERRARRRAIHLIRHGESEYNLACRRRGGFGDPGDIFDACLTPTGQGPPAAASGPDATARRPTVHRVAAVARHPDLPAHAARPGAPEDMLTDAAAASAAGVVAAAAAIQATPAAAAAARHGAGDRQLVRLIGADVQAHRCGHLPLFDRVSPHQRRCGTATVGADRELPAACRAAAQGSGQGALVVRERQ